MTDLLDRAATKIILFNFALSLAMLFVSATGIYQFQVFAPAMSGDIGGYITTGYHVFVDSSAMLMMQLGILPNIARFLQLFETTIVGFYFLKQIGNFAAKVGILSMFGI